MNDEIEQGDCPGCGAPLGQPSGSPGGDVPAPAPTATPARRRLAPFLLGLFVGCLIGAVALWAALRLGVPLPGGTGQPAESETVRAQGPQAAHQGREAEAGRPGADPARTEALKALSAANRKAADTSRQKEDAERRLNDALARLARERRQRASLEKALAEGKGPRLTPALSSVRDWQLLGPFPSTGAGGHDAVYPPEREPVRLEKAYDGFGGRVKWRAYHSPDDKIDLAAFFQYWQSGAAYAVSWVYSDADQAVVLGVGSDDGVRVWVNGEKVHDVKGGRQARPGQDVVKARLRKEWNEVRAKVDNIVGTWELYLEFRTADGGQPLKVFSTNVPPPAAAR